MLSDYTAMQLALNVASKSLDPNTRVGAVIVDPEGSLLSYGCNALPRRIDQKPERLQNKALKLKLIVHAEMNAVLSAARQGKVLDHSTLYLAARRPTGSLTWGGPPCTRCLVELLQAGISRIVSLPQRPGKSSWKADLLLSRQLIEESGIHFEERTLSDLVPDHADYAKLV